MSLDVSHHTLLSLADDADVILTTLASGGPWCPDVRGPLVTTLLLPTSGVIVSSCSSSTTSPGPAKHALVRIRVCSVLELEGDKSPEKRLLELSILAYIVP